MAEPYPEHAKLAMIQEEHAAVRDFLEAITSAGYQICRNEDSGYRTGFHGESIVLRWTPQDWREVVSVHFAIDENGLERERRAMLANLGGGAS